MGSESLASHGDSIPGLSRGGSGKYNNYAENFIIQTNKRTIYIYIYVYTYILIIFYILKVRLHVSMHLQHLAGSLCFAKITELLKFLKLQLNKRSRSKVFMIKSIKF